MNSNPNDNYIYNTNVGPERTESSYRQEHARVTSELERIRPMFNHGAGFNNRVFNKVFEHMKEKGPEEESIREPEAVQARMQTYGTAEDGGQQMLKEDREIRGMTQLERAYRSHTNPDAYTESVIERCRSKPDMKERPLTSQEAQQKIDMYRQISASTHQPDARPQIQMQPIKTQTQQFIPPPQPPPQQTQFMPPPQQTQFMPQPQFMPPPQQTQFMPPQTQFMPPPQQTQFQLQTQFMPPPQQTQFMPQLQPQFMQTQQPQFHPQLQPHFQNQTQYRAPVRSQFQSDFYVPPPQMPEIQTQQVKSQMRAPPPEPVPVQQRHRRTNTMTANQFSPDDYRFYTQQGAAADNAPTPVNIEQDLTDLKSMVKKQELLIKLLLQQRK